MQGLKVLANIVDEIARVNGIVDGQMHKWKTGCLCCTMPAGATKITATALTLGTNASYFINLYKLICVTRKGFFQAYANKDI